MYILFAVDGSAPSGWVLAEIAVVGIYGTLGVLGVRGSAWWLATGWALHPLGDMTSHFFGPGQVFTPIAYPVSCLSYDLLVTAYVAIAYGVRLVGARRRSDLAC
jgi:hypothetical protein